MSLLNLPIGELKRQLATGKDLATVMKFFFDSFVDHPGFLQAGHPVPASKQLQEIVGKFIDRVWPNQNVITEWLVIEVPLLGIVHGTVNMNGKPTTLLWAPDIAVGIIALPDIRTGNTMYGRITVTDPTKKQ
jgi:hypothetical protein